MKEVYIIEERYFDKSTNELLSHGIHSVWSKEQDAVNELNRLWNSFKNNKCGWNIDNVEKIDQKGFKLYGFTFASKKAILTMRVFSVDELNTFFLINKDGIKI